MSLTEVTVYKVIKSLVITSSVTLPRKTVLNIKQQKKVKIFNKTIDIFYFLRHNNPTWAKLE